MLFYSVGTISVLETQSLLEWRPSDTTFVGLPLLGGQMYSVDLVSMSFFGRIWKNRYARPTKIAIHEASID